MRRASERAMRCEALVEGDDGATEEKSIGIVAPLSVHRVSARSLTTQARRVTACMPATPRDQAR